MLSLSDVVPNFYLHSTSSLTQSGSNGEEKYIQVIVFARHVDVQRFLQQKRTVRNRTKYWKIYIDYKIDLKICIILKIDYFSKLSEINY